MAAIVAVLGLLPWAGSASLRLACSWRRSRPTSYVRKRQGTDLRIKKLARANARQPRPHGAQRCRPGLGLADAFRLVAEEMALPVAAEFGRVFEEVRFGRDYREALENLLERNPGIFDLQLFVSSVLLQRETGGNLIEILDNISDTIRAALPLRCEGRGHSPPEARFSAFVLGSLADRRSALHDHWSATRSTYLRLTRRGDHGSTCMARLRRRSCTPLVPS